MKKLVLVLLIAIVASCTKADLTIQKQATFNLDELKEYVLPPKLNTTPINIIKSKINHENNNLDGLHRPPPPGPHCDLPENAGDCQRWDTLVFNGANKINVVFIAEGFFDLLFDDDANGIDAYNIRVDSLITGLFTYEPFKSNQNEFNFFTYRTIPYDVGPNYTGVNVVEHPSNDEVAVTYDHLQWNIFRNYAGLPRYTNIPDIDRARLYDSLIQAPHRYLKKKKIYAVILCNEEIFAGSGEFPAMYGNKQKMSITILTKSTENNRMIELFVHEFGHAFGDLDDEYRDDTFASLAPTYDPIVWNYPDRLNVTRDTINDQKWNPLDYTDTDNKFHEGARYLENGIFKSTKGYKPVTCVQCGFMMERIDKSFSQLNIELIQNRIDNH